MKTDLTKRFKSYYTAPSQPELTESGLVPYISVQGKGDPSGAEFAGDVQALYTVAYALKFQMKPRDLDFVVAKLEGLWSFDTERFGRPDMTRAPVEIPRSEWSYRLLIRMPDFVSPEDLYTAIDQCMAKGKLATKDVVSWFEMNEGKVVHLLHTGPFSTEPESLQKIKVFCDAHGLQQNGMHHEIYLSDFRKTAPERLRTILREPVC